MLQQYNRQFLSVNKVYVHACMFDISIREVLRYCTTALATVALPIGRHVPTTTNTDR